MPRLRASKSLTLPSTGPDNQSVLTPKTTASRPVISPAAKEARPHSLSAQTSAIQCGLDRILPT